MAHQVARPAVPVTMFVAGLAAAELPTRPTSWRWLEARAAAWTAEQ